MKSLPLRKAQRQSIGPGILLAGACIGGSHLMSSTTAGARFGFALVGLILLTNLLKYPFLKVGTRFTAASGISLLEGFKRRNKLYIPIYFLVSLFTGSFTIAAVSFVSGLLLTNIPIFESLDPYTLSMIVLVICGVIILIGKYKALDLIAKFLVFLLTLLTFFAVISLLIKGPVVEYKIDWFSPTPSPWSFDNLTFLIPLMGWMPGPVEMCVWPSLWMFSRASDTNHMPSPQEAEYDFNIGYLITVITAIFFVILGAYTMYGSGENVLSGSGVSFAQKLIKIYTSAIGGWAFWVIVPAAISAMVSTTLTCLDAYPRSISVIQRQSWQKDDNINRIMFTHESYILWVLIHLSTSLIALLIARSGGISVKDFVFGAMTGSFLTAPIFAWMAMDTINSHLVPIEHRYGKFMRTLCWIGLTFLSIFSLLFVLRFLIG